MTSDMWMAESEGELKSLLMRVMVENEKAGLKLNIKKTKTMASGSITSWQIEEEKVEAVTDFLFLGSKITADGDCSQEIRRWLVLGRKTLTNLDSVLKSRHQFANKGLYSQGYSLSSGHIWMWELDHKEGRVLRNWCFELWWWWRLLRVPWTTKRSNQSILREINPEYSVGGLMLKLKLQLSLPCEVTKHHFQRAWAHMWVWANYNINNKMVSGATQPL